MRLIDIGLHDPHGEAVRRRKMQLPEPVEPDPEDSRHGRGKRNPGSRETQRVFCQHPPEQEKQRDVHQHDEK